MSSIDHWLEQHGLGKYADVFAEAEIELEDLFDLTADDLEKLGLPLGPRKRFLRAIATTELRPSQSRDTKPSQESVEGAPTRDEAERRHLTVMFADLVGSTQLTQVLDPEDLREVNRAYQDAAKAAIQEYDGYVARYMGDGVLAYFGYPQAHEDDAERAVHAGLALVDAVSGIDAVGLVGVHLELGARVGIASGSVVVGDLIGERSSQERAAVGETPNLAARIQALASPHSVAVAPATYRLTQSIFSFEPLGPHELKGIAGFTEVWKVAGEQHFPSRFRATRGRSLTPLVGRDDELSMLERRWEEVGQGCGHAFLIGGEPGIGKSRLIESFGDRIEDNRLVWLCYQCSPYHATTPFYPVASQLSYAAGLSREIDAHEKLERLKTYLALTPETLAESLGALAELVGISAGGISGVQEITPGNLKRRTIVHLRRHIYGLSLDAPVVCVFEDLHWADPSTLELIDELIADVETQPLLLILTFRPEFTVPWVGQPCTTSVTVGRMGLRDSLRLVEAGWRNAGIDGQLAQSIARRADGVPLFLEELAQAAAELSMREAASFDKDAEHQADRPAIPETLRDALMSRLDRSAAALQVAQLASVIGRDFDYSVLEAASESTAEEVRQGIEHLVEGGLVQVQRNPPDANCRFKHALIRDAAYATLTRSRRIAMHANVAGVLIGDTVPDPSNSSASKRVSMVPELIAHHLTEAGSVEEAVGYWEQAGDGALRRGAQPEAAAHFAQGIELLCTLEHNPERRQKELSLLLRLGQAQFGAFGGAAPQTMETFRAAADLSRKWGEVIDECRALYGRWIGLIVSGQTVEGLTVGNRVTALARDNKEEWLAVIGHRLKGTPLYLQGQLREGKSELEKVLSLREATAQALPAFAHNPFLTALPTLAHIECALGYADTALRRSESAIVDVKKCSADPNTLSYALVWHMLLFLLRREAARAKQTAQILKEHAERSGGKFWSHFALWGSGGAEILDNKPTIGIPVLREGLSGYMATGGRQQVPIGKLLEAEGWLLKGDFERCISVLDQTRDIIAKTHQLFYQPELCRVHGEALSRQGNNVGAEREFRSAIELAGKQEARSWQLRASVSLARLWHQTGRAHDAGTLLNGVYSWFTEGFDTPDLKEAAALLEELLAHQGK